MDNEPHNEPDEFGRQMNRAFAFTGLSMLIVMVAGPATMFLLTGLAPHTVFSKAVVYAAAVAVGASALIGLVLSGIRSVEALRKAQGL